MRMRMWSATCAAIAVGTAVGILAQVPDSPQKPPASKSSAAAKTISVTGCIQRAQASTAAPGGAGAPGAAAGSEAKFVLTNVVLKPEGTAGTTGSTNPPTAVASEYRLDTDDAKLTPHVGHKVEITGTVEQPSEAAAQPPAGSAASAPKLKVDNVKMVAATCS
jgi:hypothetical protein